jgi:hypothetical protein
VTLHRAVAADSAAARAVVKAVFDVGTAGLTESGSLEL